MKKIIFIVFTVFLSINYSFSQDTTKTVEAKTNWNFGALPTITYNTDLGLQYGLLTNIYYYGDGKIYPKYYHSIYAEVSRYTKGSGIYRLFYDSKYLINNIRTTFDIHYLTEDALDFYGFNGYQSVYNSDWEDDENTDNSYKTRMFYKHKRNIFNAKFDFLGNTGINNLNWVGGILLTNVKVDNVDINKLNKGKSDDKILPDTATLYQQYIDWGIIKENEKDGGFFTTFKAGAIYDTRDNEPNPWKGIWTELVLSQTLNSEFNFTKFGFTHRQYFTLAKEKLSFAYRLGYQSIIAGNAPFYALPTMIYSYNPSVSSDGLGGSKTLRGIKRNRVVGTGMAFGNIELRYRFAKFRFINQNFYTAFSPFMDFGQVVVEYKIDKSGIPSEIDQTEYFKTGADALHITYGGGLHIAMNENFIIAADIGMPVNKQDGGLGIYIGMNFLF